MKQIVAVIKPFLAEKVIQSLGDLDLEQVCIREVKGFGRQKNFLDRYGENEYSLAFLPKVEITVWAHDQHVTSIVDRIKSVSRTGRLGDGKIFVTDVVDDQSIGELPT